MNSRKRGRPESSNEGASKKSKTESDSLSSGIGSKSKPCKKFFSSSGCSFGEKCHFLHYVPGGYKVAAQMMNSAPGAIKTKMCNKFKTEGGCMFGDKCNFAHGEWELGKLIAPSHLGGGPMPGRFGGGRMKPHIAGPAASFGATTTTKISVDASLAGIVVGKGGAYSKRIYQETGVKLLIRDHESDPNLKNIELEGTLERIGEAREMVREKIESFGPAYFGSNSKKKLCENFTRGSCMFGERCHFAHVAAELRETG